MDMAKLGRMVEQTQAWLTDEDIARIADTCDESAGRQASRAAGQEHPARCRDRGKLGDGGNPRSPKRAMIEQEEVVGTMAKARFQTSGRAAQNPYATKPLGNL